MNEAKAEKIIEEVNREHGLELDIWDVFQPELVTEEEFRRMALRAGGVEDQTEEQEPEDEWGKTYDQLKAEGKTDNEIFRYGLQALRARNTRKRREREQRKQDWLKARRELAE